jgi:AraC-like DNA-binding protein
LGVDTDAALEPFSLTSADIVDLDEAVPLSFLHDLWQSAIDTSGECGLGVRLSESVRPEIYELFGYVLTSSATLGDALLRATRFTRLVSSAVELAFSVDGDVATLTLKPLIPELIHRESTEFMIGAIANIARVITGERLVAHEVRFAHPAPADTSHHRRILVAPLRFDHPQTGYVFDAALLHTPVIGGDSKLCAILEKQARQLLEDLPRVSDLSRRVQEAISAELRGGNPSAENVAEKLGVHPRTLSRRLQAEGTSHQQLLDQLRFELAERYLREPGLSIGEVAYLLGYADTSSFNKAFKRWTGSAPKRYRQQVD